MQLTALFVTISLVAATTAAPVFNGALFPNSRAGSVIGSFKSTALYNPTYAATRNPAPQQIPGENGLPNNTKGAITVDESRPDRVVIQGNTAREESANDSAAAYSVNGYDDADVADADAAEFGGVVGGNRFDRSYTNTRNGVPSNEFVDGSQREFTVERTSSQKKNGVPIDEYIEGDDTSEEFTVNKSQDGYKTCTRNGLPCEEYNRLAKEGKLPEEQKKNNYATQSTGKPEYAQAITRDPTGEAAAAKAAEEPAGGSSTATSTTSDGFKKVTSGRLGKKPLELLGLEDYDF